MSDSIDLIVKLIPLFPLMAVIVNGLFGHRYSHDLAHRFAWGSVLMSFLCVLAVFTETLRTGAAREVVAYKWIFGGDLTINLAYLIDPLTCIMLLVITGVGFLIHVYSVGYMHGESGFTRFFVYMNLFMVSMLLLVMGNNYVVLFIGWEGVGLCSYLLIGYYYDKVSAAKAATKAFVVNRIGDAGFLLAIFLVFVNFRTLDYTQVMQNAAQLSPEMATAIALCLLIGAVGKSAQLPLYTWLPDAMEGPTPVSALIHAATMVTAGVYMIVRNHAIFDLSPTAMTTVAWIGGLTALFAATIGLVQTDIKRVLAYSTVSQLGYMFLGCGLGAYTAAVFHLMTHAFFKALLFLSAGSVIHALSGEQDIRKMGALKSKIPWTHTLFLIGTIAIAGIPPLAGFWSKDEIMGHAFVHHHYPYAYNSPYKFTDPDGRCPMGCPDDIQPTIEDSATLLGWAADGLEAVDQFMTALGPQGSGLSKLSVAPLARMARPLAVEAKAAAQLAKNVAQGAKAEAKVAAEMGAEVAGKRVTLEASTGQRSVADIVTTNKGVVEVKSGGAQLSSGQKAIKADVEAGRPVTPRGQNAADAGLTPNQPVQMKCYDVKRC